jgi:hypothetical protein
MMLEELQRSNYSAVTTRIYLRVVAEFAKFFGKSPDKFGLNELRTYQAYLLRERKLTPGTVINQVAALRFFFPAHFPGCARAGSGNSAPYLDIDEFSKFLCGYTFSLDSHVT